ncbi:MAG: FHA domain-containing protein [Cyanobium sp.]
MTADPRLVLRADPSRATGLNRSVPTTIGGAGNNSFCLAGCDGVAPHHAVVRYSRSHGWLVCDWGSPQGTYLEGQKLQRCRPLADGDEIQLGQGGPVLLFQAPGGRAAAGSGQAVSSSSFSSRDPRSGADQPAAGKPSRPSSGSVRPRPAGQPLLLDGKSIPLEQIRSAHVRSRPRYPHSFSWWVLLCLGGLILLPFPWMFWSLEIGALAGWIVLGSRKEHVLVITLRDGMAHRHGFSQRLTALSHRNGIRKAIGQSLESS